MFSVRDEHSVHVTSPFYAIWDQKFQMFMSSGSYEIAGMMV